VALLSLRLAVPVSTALYQAIARAWVAVLGGAGLAGVAIAWRIDAAIILYARRLAKNGVLS